MRKFSTNPNVDNSNLVLYPDGRIQDNTGAGNGTPVNERVYGDIYQALLKVKRLSGIIENGLPDNETNGFQLVDALRELASKNDILQSISTDATTLSVTAKLNPMLTNETLICKANANYTAEAQIQGTDGTIYALTVVGSFKTNESVMLIKTGVGVTLIRVADAVSLDSMVSEFLYLKKASQAQEDAGAVDTVATTPLVNKVTFAKRVNGVDSATYLATALINGLYPKEHFAIVAALGASPTKNIGWFSGFDPGAGTVGANLPVSGDITNAEIVQVSSGVTVVECTVANALSSTDFEVQMSVESQSTFLQDTTVYVPLFKVINTTTFQVGMREPGSFTQNIKIHCRTIQL